MAADPTSPPRNHLAELPLLGTTALPAPATGSHLACNPVIALAVTVGEAGAALHVWRAGDQGLVSKHLERGGRKVEAIAWREDGQVLAAGWSDGVVRLMGLEGGKAVHQIRVSDECRGSGDGAADGGRIVFIAWRRNVTAEGRRRRGKGDGQVGTDERRILLDGERTGDVAVDLPRELIFLEAETALPKLSPLPAGGAADDMFLFSSTASLETLFRPCQAEDADNVHVMVVGTADGGIHLSLNDSFVVGTLKTPHHGEVTLELCGHSSRAESSTHMLLLQPRAGDGTRLYLLPMRLGFLDHSPVNLSLLASKVTSLQNLLRYLKATLSHMANEWQSTQELPRRFMAGVEDDLKRLPSGSMTVVQALYHTAATGHVFEPLKEWLLDTLGDRGHKRWEKAVVAGLTGLRDLVHGNFIPALERCGVILSRLLGIARFYGPEEAIGFDEDQVRKLTDIVSCLMMTAHRVLTIVMDELEHFGAFSTWLRLEIDKQGSSSHAEELSEKEATMDHPKVLSYIRYYLASSPLALHLEEVAKEDYIRDREMVTPGLSLTDLLDKQLREHDAGRSYMKVLPRIGFQLNYLTAKANAVFEGIANSEKQGVEFGRATEVSVGRKIWKHHLWMGRTGNRNHSTRVFTAVVLEDDKSRIYIVRSDVPLSGGVGEATATRACGLGLPDGATIVDFKFLDDKSLLVLCSQKGKESIYKSGKHIEANEQTEEPKSVLLRIAYQSARMPYQEHVEGQTPPMLELGGTRKDIVTSSYAFSNASGFTPIQMEVQRASKLRGEIPARVCLLGRDRAVLRTYALPSTLDEEKNQQ
ncbi:anaphase-promoting complex, cyclosome, subunit 4-domain-containing protein [Thermothelomyces heterothallicus CBS 202.75]|uniref:anaphase-promoting complex, cyclosome, subunit 4-domain-containing protein n=1 Tax=Thermothelomyces heterothallicus CBS 202.75 TaxID=1149848 RepID=UPI003742E499